MAQDPATNRIASAFTGKVGPNDEAQSKNTTANPLTNPKEKAQTTQGTGADKVMDAFFGSYGNKSVPPKPGS